MNTNQKFGYGRVYTLDKNLDGQEDALLKAGATKGFV
jgi:DNA invertase Pin-like site-specific DNA recombinase